MIRHTLTFIGGGFVSSGMFTQEEISAVIGAVVTLIGFAWSIYEKRSKK